MTEAPSREAQLLAGKYRLEARLGAGGMGEVYRATNELIGRPVAIKLLHSELTEHREVVTRFMREAKAANLVRHPNVVDVLDVGLQDDGAPFIVQELLEGGDLGDYLRRIGGRLTPDLALTVLIPVADAVGVAHSRNVVHRDLKPENVFLCTAEGGVVPKVLDFGISKIVDDPNARMTVTGSPLGTPAYMSPEQIQKSSGVDARTDVWALGVMLYEMLSGELPFQAATHGGLFVKICIEDPTPLETLVPDAPRELVAIVKRCLARSPDERYATAGELAVHLRKLLQSRGGDPPAAGAVLKIAQPPALQARETARDGSAWASGPTTPAVGEGVSTAFAGATPAKSNRDTPTVAVGAGASAAASVPRERQNSPAEVRQTALGWTQPGAAPRRTGKGRFTLAAVATVGLLAAGAFVFRGAFSLHPQGGTANPAAASARNVAPVPPAASTAANAPEAPPVRTAIELPPAANAASAAPGNAVAIPMPAGPVTQALVEPGANTHAPEPAAGAAPAVATSALAAPGANTAVAPQSAAAHAPRGHGATAHGASATSPPPAAPALPPQGQLTAPPAATPPASGTGHPGRNLQHVEVEY